MENNVTHTPPDFEKLAKEYYGGNPLSQLAVVRTEGFEQGAEKIWNDYVLPEKQKNDELSKEIEEVRRVRAHEVEFWQSAFNDKNDEVERLKIEASKAVERRNRRVQKSIEMIEELKSQLKESKRLLTETPERLDRNDIDNFDFALRIESFLSDTKEK